MPLANFLRHNQDDLVYNSFMSKILIAGATSAIAKAAARLWAGKGHSLYLLARNQQQLDKLGNDLKLRGATAIHTALFDCADTDAHKNIINTARDSMNGIDIALVAVGTLGNQEKCNEDFNATLAQLQTDAIGVMSILTHLANIMQAQQHGTMAVISSVAGDRGRQSNYCYGTAKGAVSIFSQGLRHRLARHGVHVLTVKPGFVDTPMTEAFSKGPLWAQPETIAHYIDNGINKKKNVVYAPWFWRYIMLVIRLIPESIFKKTSL